MVRIRTYLLARTKEVLLVCLALLPFLAQAQEKLPDIPDLIRVTVDHSDDGVLIQWEASNSPAIMSYLIYEKVDDVFLLLDSVPSSTFQYKDMSIGKGSLPYAVIAKDSSLNESNFGLNYQRLVYLSTNFDLCTQSNIIEWTGYEGWEGNISGYRVFGGRSGDPLAELTFVPAVTTSFSHSGVEANYDYVYYIETVKINGAFSLSSLDTVSVTNPQAPAYLTIDHVSVLDEASVEIQFSADISGLVKGFRLLRRSNPDSPFTEVETRWDVTGSTQVVQDAFITSTYSYQYLVESVYQPDGCATSLVISQSNTGNSILLTNEINDQIVSLNWTPYESYEPGLAGYIVQRMEANGTFVDVASVGPLTTQWQGPIQTTNNGSQVGEVTYRVIALSNPLSGGTVEESISNVSNVVVETHMQVPNAFIPGSTPPNDEFKPLMDFTPREYLMIVVDRGGRKMFETTDPNEGWDGRFQGGSLVDEAVYVYHIEYTDYTGLFKTYTGNVSVIYP